MLARSTILKHPLGGTIQTPCLVPSFSSKGFRLLRKKDGFCSETSDWLTALNDFLTDAVLVSGYDLYHRFLRVPQGCYVNKALTFIDSGGYELSPEYDLTEPKYGLDENAPVRRKHGFTEPNYRKVLTGLPQLPFVISNFDWATKRCTLKRQLEAAQALFSDFPDFLHNFVVKPGRGRLIKVDEVAAHLDALRQFHIIGFTERELGDSLLDRLQAIAAIRAEMDRREVNAPIHIYGGLDPVLSSLYFFAGAEIFDGLSWLRYGYHRGMSVYQASQIVLSRAVDLGKTFTDARVLTMFDNIRQLSRLSDAFREFISMKGQCFSMFSTNGDGKIHDCFSLAIKRCYEDLCKTVPALKGGA